MTKVFVYLHGGDVCNYENNITLKKCCMICDYYSSYKKVCDKPGNTIYGSVNPSSYCKYFKLNKDFG